MHSSLLLGLYERGILDLHVWTTTAGEPEIWSSAFAAATSTSTRHWPCYVSCDVSLKVLCLRRLTCLGVFDVQACKRPLAIWISIIYSCVEVHSDLLVV